MGRSRGARWGEVLGFVGSLSLGCGSTTAGGGPTNAAGAAGSNATAGAQNGGTGGRSGGACGAGGTGGTGTGGGAAPGGAGGGAPINGTGDVIGSGGAGAAGAAGAVGTGGGAQTRFVDQILASQGGGPLKCLPIALPTGQPGSATDGRVACLVAEEKAAACACSQGGRGAALSSSQLALIVNRMRALGSCDGSSGVPCDSVCACEVPQPDGVAGDLSSQLHACQNDVAPPASVSGFCLIDATLTDASGAPAPLGNADLVAGCPATQKRLLRFVGADYPASGATLFLACPAPAP